MRGKPASVHQLRKTGGRNKKSYTKNRSMRVTTGLIGLKGRFTGFQGLRKCRLVPAPARDREKENEKER